MGPVGDCFDNALAESSFATLECELVARSRWWTPAEARMVVFDFIQGFYNPRRRHSALDYLSPAEYVPRHRSPIVAANRHLSAESGRHHYVRRRVAEFDICAFAGILTLTQEGSGDTVGSRGAGYQPGQALPTPVRQGRAVITICVDTYKRLHVAFALDGAGRALSNWRERISPAGRWELHQWAIKFGAPRLWGIEGARNCGSGHGQHLVAPADSSDPSVIEIPSAWQYAAMRHAD